jgi:hypothetical protein
VAALPCIQHILDANRLTWPGVGQHPDCPFASFIHASQQQEPTWDLIIDTLRKCRSWLRLDPPDDFVPEAWTKRCNEYSIFKPGLVTRKRGRVMNTRYSVLQACINSALISLYSFVKSSSHKDNPPPQQEQSSSDNFADIPHVQGGFVHNLYQSGALKLVRQLYLSGDASDCGKRVLFGIYFENCFVILKRMNANTAIQVLVRLCMCVCVWVWVWVCSFVCVCVDVHVVNQHESTMTSVVL